MLMYGLCIIDFHGIAFSSLFSREKYATFFRMLEQFVHISTQQTPRDDALFTHSLCIIFHTSSFNWVRQNFKNYARKME